MYLLEEQKRMKNSVTEINTLQIVDKLAQRYREFLDDEFKTLGRRRITAVYLAEIMEDTYTCTETLFLRISQFFENSISQDRWHQDLLKKDIDRFGSFLLALLEA